MTDPKPALTRHQLHDALYRAVAKQSGKDLRQLQPNHRLVHDLGTDSLAVVELAMELEDLLGKTVPDTVFEKKDLTLGELEDRLWETRG